jgi:polyferredoxin
VKIKNFNGIEIKPKIIKNPEKPVWQERLIVQTFYLFLVIWIGIQFHFFVRWLESGGLSHFTERPPGVEAFLPIGSLMSLLYFFKTGNINMIHPAGLFIFVAILTVSFLFGKSFCSWICPIGMLSEYIGEFGAKMEEKIFGKEFKLPKILDYPLRSLKYFLMFFFVYAVFTMTTEELKAFLNSPYNVLVDVKMYYFFAHITMFSFTVIAILFFLSIVIRNFWCRYLCPYGALLGIFSLLSVFKIKRNKETCIDCGLCARACPHHIKVDKVTTVISDECTTCLACLDACPVADTLELKTVVGNKKLSKKYVGLIILIIYFAITGYGMISGKWQNNVPKQTYLELYKNIDNYQH